MIGELAIKRDLMKGDAAEGELVDVSTARAPAAVVAPLWLPEDARFLRQYTDEPTGCEVTVWTHPSFPERVKYSQPWGARFDTPPECVTGVPAGVMAERLGVEL